MEGGERRDGWIERRRKEGDTLILLCHDLGGCLSFYGNKIETAEEVHMCGNLLSGPDRPEKEPEK